MEDWSECLDVAVQVARRAGQPSSVRSCSGSQSAALVSGSSWVFHFEVSHIFNVGRFQVVSCAVNQEKQVSSKSTPTDLVTETDHQVEELIISTLRQKYPTHRFIGEESAAAGGRCELSDAPTWIIDPIDGTCNFVHSFPMVAVSIGFAVRRELEFGVIYHCFEGTLFTGRRGHGAFCDGVRLHVSRESEMSKALILTEIGAKRDPATLDVFLGNMRRILSAPTHGVRIVGSSTLALCQVASGAAEGYYQYGLHCWDIAAAAVIIREAGGCVMDTTGAPLDLMSRRVVAAGTPEIAESVLKLLQPIDYGRDDNDL
ncbi:hypothetical protein DNTS_004432 [Danionella cerebrum]|uniref:Inositol-1-monophosphatase n=1 Tax=Danionella cerebrum TaxID=2873325 RepID=A0A553R7B2_9TELE|nr:hypothetical protein DNTS_004432 [Danionella translucida]